MKKITLMTGMLLLTFSTYSQVKEKEITTKSLKGKAELINFSETKIDSDDKSVNDFLVKQFDSQKSSSSKNTGKAKTEFRVKQENNIKEGKLESKKYQQFYNGIKVEFGIQNVVAENGKLKTSNGRYVDVNNVKTTAKLSENEALGFAVRDVNAEKYMWESKENEDFIKKEQGNTEATFYPKGELVIVEKDLYDEKSVSVLAYKFDIYASKPVSRDYVYVDANTGAIIMKDAIIKHVQGTGSTRYSGQRTIETQWSGSQYRLRDYSRGNGVETVNMNRSSNYFTATDFIDNDNNWTAAEHDNVNKDNVALDAHWGAEKTYDYFLTKHNRNSYNGSGAVLRNYVHANLIAMDFDSNANAFWDGQRMTYGDGNNIYSPLTSIDIVGHEIGHAVCSSTANLKYEKESGAINEALSDIWGAMIEYYADPTKQTYLLGEEVKLWGSMRSMSNPKSEMQPDTYGGFYYLDTNNCSPSKENDKCYVHTNSGVMNYWFYILAEGKAGTNDKGYSYNFFGIGKDNAARIVYRAETVYFTSTTNYLQAREWTIQAAKDLFGINSAEALTVCQAWTAVGVGSTNCGAIPSKFTGPDTICASANYQYVYANPENAAVVWSVSSNLQIISSSNIEITVRAIDATVNGTATITMNINGLISTKEIWVGQPYSYYTADRVEFCNFNYMAKDYPGTTQGATFSWQFVSGTGNASANNFYSSGPFAQFTACPPFSIRIKLTSTNACGTTEQFADLSLNNDDEEINITAPTSNKYFVYPNPAKDIVNIKLIEQNNQPANNVKIVAELFDLTGQSRAQVEINDNNASFSVRDLEKGVYVLRININNQVESHQIIIE